MRIHKTEALVLKRTDFSNTSQILDLFTRDRGRIPVMAKGTRRYGNRAYRLVDLLYRGNVILLEKSTREVQILSDFEPLNHYPGLRSDLERYHAGLHLLHCLRKATRPEGEDHRLYTLSVRALSRFESAPLERLPAEVLAFDFRFLAVIGFQLMLEHCPRCGVRHKPGSDTLFHAPSGGCICPRCRSGGADTLSASLLTLSGEARSILLGLARLTGSDRDRVPLPRARVLELRKILNTALTSWLEAELPMLKYLLPP